ncbi:MAG: hypothetical protein K1X74_12215 [Pirellulales bacterium]|nr:hypothetical protein [Pirellulales bacterium]
MTLALLAPRYPEEDDGGYREANQYAAGAEELARRHRASIPEKSNDEQNGEEHERRRKELVHG